LRNFPAHRGLLFACFPGEASSILVRVPHPARFWLVGKIQGFWLDSDSECRPAGTEFDNIIGQQILFDPDRLAVHPNTIAAAQVGDPERQSVAAHYLDDGMTATDGVVQQPVKRDIRRGPPADGQFVRPVELELLDPVGFRSRNVLDEDTGNHLSDSCSTQPENWRGDRKVEREFVDWPAAMTVFLSI
jgi:hypothetical protein